jgi:anti-sigma factor RsiW
MTTKKFSDEDLMKFVDGELHDSSLSIDIMSEVLAGNEDLKQRLKVYADTRDILTKKGNTLLLNLLN